MNMICYFESIPFTFKQYKIFPMFTQPQPNKGGWECSIELLKLLAVNILIYHMTRTAPRAISLQNHKRKGPVWGPNASEW